jgi:hypothetical protein
MVMQNLKNQFLEYDYFNAIRIDKIFLTNIIISRSILFVIRSCGLDTHSFYSLLTSDPVGGYGPESGSVLFSEHFETSCLHEKPTALQSERPAFQKSGIFSPYGPEKLVTSARRRRRGGGGGGAESYLLLKSLEVTRADSLTLRQEKEEGGLEPSSASSSCEYPFTWPYVRNHEDEAETTPLSPYQKAKNYTILSQNKLLIQRDVSHTCQQGFAT